MNRLKEILDERGIRQTWLCEKTGISNTTMSLLVQCKREPTLQNARKISKALGLTIEEVFPDPEDERGMG